MRGLLAQIVEHAPPASVLVVEADERFDFGPLVGGNAAQWDIRAYPPAVVGIWRFN
jgi:hypothetical protein